MLKLAGFVSDDAEGNSFQLREGLATPEGFLLFMFLSL